MTNVATLGIHNIKMKAFFAYTACIFYLNENEKLSQGAERVCCGCSIITATSLKKKKFVFGCWRNLFLHVYTRVEPFSTPSEMELIPLNSGQEALH